MQNARLFVQCCALILILILSSLILPPSLLLLLAFLLLSLFSLSRQVAKVGWGLVLFFLLNGISITCTKVSHYLTHFFWTCKVTFLYW